MEYEKEESFIHKTKEFSNPYDARSGQAVNMGEKHGVGKKTPVGSEKHKKESPIPCGRK